MPILKRLLLIWMLMMAACAHSLKPQPENHNSEDCQSSVNVRSVVYKDCYNCEETENRGLLSKLKSAPGLHDNSSPQSVKIEVVGGYNQLRNKDNLEPGSFILIKPLIEPVIFDKSIKVVIYKGESPKQETIASKDIEYQKTIFIWNIFWKSWTTLLNDPVENEVFRVIKDELQRCS